MCWTYKALPSGLKTKIPVQPDGRPASTTDPATWRTYDEVRGQPNVGFVFRKADGFVYWGGVLTFSGTPSSSTFINATFEEWAYVTPATYSASPSVYPDAVFVPSQGAYLALTSITYASATPLTTAQINSLISNVPYLGVNPN